LSNHNEIHFQFPPQQCTLAYFALKGNSAVLSLDALYFVLREIENDLSALHLGLANPIVFMTTLFGMLRIPFHVPLNGNEIVK